MLEIEPYLLVFVISLILGGAAFLYIAVHFNENNTRKRQLKKIAKQHYLEARGTAHKRILSRTSAVLLSQIQSAESKKRLAADNLQNLKSKKEDDLNKALITHLVSTRLTEVSGIGPKLAADIRRLVFRGNLSDLRYATNIQGIGNERQLAINNWIRKYEAQLPVLRDGEFSGKAAIIDSYKKKIQAQETLYETLIASIVALRRTKNQVDDELRWLNRVRQKDFVTASLGAVYSRADVARYQQGVFAEWESVPDWFQAAMEIGGQREAPVYRKSEKLTDQSTSRWRPAVYVQRQAGIVAAGTVMAVSLLCGSFTLNASMNLPVMTATPTPTTTSTATVTITVTPTQTAPPTPSTTPTFRPSVTPSLTLTLSPSRTPEKLTPTPPPASPQPIVSPRLQAVNVRLAPDIDAEVVDILRNGESALLLQESPDGTWFFVRLESGAEGWVGTSVVEIVDDDGPDDVVEDE